VLHTAIHLMLGWLCQVVPSSPNNMFDKVKASKRIKGLHFVRRITCSLVVSILYCFGSQGRGRNGDGGSLLEMMRQVNKRWWNVHFLVYTKAIQVQEDRDTFVNESCTSSCCACKMSVGSVLGCGLSLTC
jgi:hypothetical protein